MNQGSETAVTVGVTTMGLVFVLFCLALVILIIAGFWKVFSKAGQPGWASLIPILNTYFLLKIAGKPGWWLLLLFIPVVNLVIIIITLVDLARNFAKGAGFAMGLLFLPMIFFLILGFGSATYQSGRAYPEPVIG
jgi:uncharacterized protein DUF5684